MEQSNQKETFCYTYSPKQQEEAKRIREKYIPGAESKMEQLRRLDKNTQKSGLLASLAVGIGGSLLLGTGMACIMEWAERLFAVGIVVGVVGLGCMLAAHPIYTMLTKKQRAKLAPQIISLSNELMQ